MKKFVSCITGLMILPVPLQAQKPAASDSVALIEKSRTTALAYAQSLPDFVCSEAISRYRWAVRQPNVAIKIPSSAQPEWIPIDTLTVKLSFFQQQEAHELTTVNGRPTTETFDGFDIGLSTTGEFGGNLKSIFAPVSQSSFRWEGLKNVRGLRVNVYAYQVDEAHSNYYLETGTPEKRHRAIVAFHGTLEIASDTGEVLFFDLAADRIPRQLETSKSVTAVDYDYVKIGGSRYLLPVHSRTELEGRTGTVKNESEFRDYGKYDVDSKVDFGVRK